MNNIDTHIYIIYIHILYTHIIYPYYIHSIIIQYIHNIFTLDILLVTSFLRKIMHYDYI